jgi:lipopolysaccharide export system protein LptA
MNRYTSSHAYQLIRDYFVFTNKRLVLVDKQGMTGSKVEYHFDTLQEHYLL